MEYREARERDRSRDNDQQKACHAFQFFQALYKVDIRRFELQTWPAMTQALVHISLQDALRGYMQLFLPMPLVKDCILAEEDHPPFSLQFFGLPILWRKSDAFLDFWRPSLEHPLCGILCNSGALCRVLYCTLSLVCFVRIYYKPWNQP